MATTVTVSEARAGLPALIDRVIEGEEVTLTRHGRPVAVVVRPDVLRVRRVGDALASAARIGELLERGKLVRLRDVPGISPERVEELIAEIRAGRQVR